jgi:hypothetical protein
VMQWQNLTHNVITYSTSISACEKGVQPEQALELQTGNALYGLQTKT